MKLGSVSLPTLFFVFSGSFQDPVLGYWICPCSLHLVSRRGLIWGNLYATEFSVTHNRLPTPLIISSSWNFCPACICWRWMVGNSFVLNLFARLPEEQVVVAFVFYALPPWQSLGICLREDKTEDGGDAIHSLSASDVYSL